MPDVILRFAVMSDLHYSEKHPEVRGRFERAMKTVYSYAKKQPYTGLDALYVVGDFTDRGMPCEFEMFKEDCDRLLDKNTRLVVTLANHELHYYDEEKSSEKFAELFNMPCDRHEVICGYHFISLSTMQHLGEWHDSFDEGKREFLRRALDEAVSDGPNKPIFVFQHPGVLETVAGGFFGNGELSDILGGYPRVIDFSGHSHCAVNDPREINTKHFTAVSTGSLYNICLTHKSGLYPHIDRLMKPSSSYAHMLVAEVHSDNTLRIKRLDVMAADFFEDDIIIDNIDAGELKYTDERGLRAQAPYFEKSSKISVSVRDDAVILSFPAAHGRGERVKEYHITLSDESGELYKTVMASDYPALVQEKNVEITIEGIEKKRFSISVRAFGFWNNFSNEIRAEAYL